MNSDYELIKKIKKAKKEERNILLEEIYNEYYKLVCFIISKYIRNRSDIEELANDVFIKFFQNIYFIRSSIKYYLTTTAKNTSINFLKQKNKNVVFDDELVFSIKDDKHSSNENYYEIIDYLKTFLTEKEIAIILNHVIYEMTFKNISELFKISENTVKTTYYRSLEKIKSKGGNLDE